MKPIIGVTMHTGDKKLEINETYIQSVELAGGIPLCIPHLDAYDVEQVLNKVDGLLLIGGHDVNPQLYGQEPHQKLGMFHTKRDNSDLAIVQNAFQRNMPILAICRGHQVLNVAFGGTLIQDIPSQSEQSIAHVQASLRDEATHTVKINGEKLHAIFDVEQVRTNSFHHQAIDQLGEGLVIAGVAADGINEAVEHEGHPFCIGVQWHPEAMAPSGDEHSIKLFKAFIEACK
ncbi:gamma-glutamyl-gamma-aminobutyrate hydrolase family protein [Lysinibacillus louembei]|uniref:Gamma-glutamyl-gamma-aminobutyrate hydrolase family protein n=1 Tax=Lysinibacillus louembei TaxID=1470088 RepID=A0ABZ0RYG1_9BACI|nr:gamma-glutamyl-gamma-aminobutyrate hydrolase family protein [Lysinibacillus louembei]WPK11853.1 gamma-glutamyl-gamma-aminobutyrate hydrolase family protein [Lysinibacillus louembei]